MLCCSLAVDLGLSMAACAAQETLGRHLGQDPFLEEEIPVPKSCEMRDTWI